MNCQITELPYAACSTDLYSHFANQDWSIFLDSCADLGALGRFDIIAFDPFIKIQTQGQRTTVTKKTPGNRWVSNTLSTDLFEILKTEIKPFESIINELINSSQLPQGLPFYGGAMGNFSYDLIKAGTPKSAKKNAAKDANIGIFDCFIVVDHYEEKARLIELNLATPNSAGAELSTLAQKNSTSLRQKLAGQRPQETAAELPPFQLTQAFSLDSSVGEYNAQYQRIIDYIYAGDCYQVNFAQRLSSVYSGHLWNAYTALRTKSPAPYSAFMQFPEDTLLSHSPESFLSVQQRHVTTQPIKGTRRRSPNHTEDKRLKSELTSSLKDRSENLMIVDLMRNDLGKHCKTGSITADELFTLKSFSNVHHLVSTVRGELAPNSHPLDLFRDSFPGGSITGAPKKRAMEIINELEPFDRGAYCGSLGYLSFDGQMNTNIAIRTLSNEGARLYCWGGGGIVADSNREEEYLESLDKINNLIETLNKL